MSFNYRWNEEDFIKNITFNDTLLELEHLCESLVEEVSKSGVIKEQYLMYKTYVKKLKSFIEEYEELYDSYLELITG